MSGMYEYPELDDNGLLLSVLNTGLLRIFESVRVFEGKKKSRKIYLDVFVLKCIFHVFFYF